MSQKSIDTIEEIEASWTWMDLEICLVRRLNFFAKILVELIHFI